MASADEAPAMDGPAPVGGIDIDAAAPPPTDARAKDELASTTKQQPRDEARPTAAKPRLTLWDRAESVTLDRVPAAREGQAPPIGEVERDPGEVSASPAAGRDEAATAASVDAHPEVMSGADPPQASQLQGRAEAEPLTKKRRLPWGRSRKSRNATPSSSESILETRPDATSEALDLPTPAQPSYGIEPAPVPLDGEPAPADSAAPPKSWGRGKKRGDIEAPDTPNAAASPDESLTENPLPVPKAELSPPSKRQLWRKRRPTVEQVGAEVETPDAPAPSPPDEAAPVFSEVEPPSAVESSEAESARSALPEPEPPSALLLPGEESAASALREAEAPSVVGSSEAELAASAIAEGGPPPAALSPELEETAASAEIDLPPAPKRRPWRKSRQPAVESVSPGSETDEPPAGASLEGETAAAPAEAEEPRRAAKARRWRKGSRATSQSTATVQTKETPLPEDPPAKREASVLQPETSIPVKAKRWRKGRRSSTHDVDASGGEHATPLDDEQLPSVISSAPVIATPASSEPAVVAKEPPTTVEATQGGLGQVAAESPDECSSQGASTRPADDSTTAVDALAVAPVEDVDVLPAARAEQAEVADQQDSGVHAMAEDNGGPPRGSTLHDAVRPVQERPQASTAVEDPNCGRMEVAGEPAEAPTAATWMGLAHEEEKADETHDTAALGQAGFASGGPSKVAQVHDDAQPAHDGPDKSNSEAEPSSVAATEAGPATESHTLVGDGEVDSWLRPSEQLSVEPSAPEEEQISQDGLPGAAPVSAAAEGDAGSERVLGEPTGVDETLPAGRLEVSEAQLELDTLAEAAAPADRPDSAESPVSETSSSVDAVPTAEAEPVVPPQPVADEASRTKDPAPERYDDEEHDDDHLPPGGLADGDPVLSPPLGIPPNVPARPGLWAQSLNGVQVITSALRRPVPGKPTDRGAQTGVALGRTVIVNVGLTLVGLVSAGLVPLGFNLLVGRAYGPATLGAISVALGLGLFLGQIPGTISSAATKFMAESLGRGDDDRARAVFQFLLVLVLVLSLAIAGALVALAAQIEASFHVTFLAVALTAALVPTYTMYLYFKSVYYAVGQVPAYLANEVISDLAFFAALAAIYLSGASAWLLLAFVLNNAIFAGLAVRAMRGYLQDFSLTACRERLHVLRYCVINGTGTAASLGRWSLGIAIAGVFLSHASVGLFAAALAITAPLPLLPRAISLVTFAMMARLHGAGQSQSVRLLMQHSTEWLVFVLGVPSGLAILNAPAILSLLFRPSFAGAATCAGLIIAGAYVTDISRPSIDALSSTEYVRIPTVASFAGLIVSLVVWVTLIPAFGLDMAGLGFALGALVTAGIPAIFAHRRLHTDAAVFVRPAIMLVGIGLLSLLARHGALLASLLFVAGALALYGHLLQDVWGYAGRFSRRQTTVEHSA